MPSQLYNLLHSKGETIIKKHHYVYEITNKINGTKYIGKRTCSTSIDEDSLYMGSGLLITRAINKHNIENFDKKIIKEFETADEAFQFEEELIEKLDAWKSPLYYNLKPGGKGKWTPLIGDRNPMKKLENRKKVSIAQTGILNHNYGKKAPEHVRARMREAHSGEKNGFFGKSHTEETKNKISEANKGKLLGIPKTEEHKRKLKQSSARRKPIFVNGVIYRTMSDAEKELGISRVTLRKRANDINNNDVRFIQIERSNDYRKDNLHLKNVD